MKNLQETKPVWHAIIWIIAYIVLVNIGDAISEMIGVSNSATSAILIAFSAVLLLYVNKNCWAWVYGLRWPQKSDFQKAWFYIPLAIIAILQYSKGFNSSLSFRDIAIIVVLMIGVGFIKEMLFRGFLYQGILKDGKLTNAIVISGLTFGIGHIVNLMRGYSLADQGLQIVIAIAIGITLALLVAVTGNIIPSVLFHILLNISGNVTNNNLTMELYVVIFSIILCVAYSLYLKKWLTTQKESVHSL
ncbi:MAG: CPBP family intramembrane metalloprotease [Chloroflexi bacterium]|nr:CPBP family intramembrane metalloprotease [Chloroflexota bacterium]